MNAYSEDLRKNIVEAKERGMPTVEVARTFSVGLSSGMRYAKVARQGGSLHPKREEPGQRPPKADERARRLSWKRGPAGARPAALPSARGASSTCGAWGRARGERVHPQQVAPS